MFALPCAIVALLSLYLSFLRFGVLVQIWSRPYGLCHRPYTLAHIKGFGSPYFACLCLLALMLYAFVSLSCFMLCHAWRPPWVHGYVVTYDAQEALFGCNHLGHNAVMPVASCIPFPFSAPCNDMLTMLVCATHLLSMHLYMLAHMSMHEIGRASCRERVLNLV